jgi:Ca2+-binding RTX toxin-like protein
MATFEVESNETSGTATDVGSFTAEDTSSYETGGQLKSGTDVDYFKFSVTGTTTGSSVNWTFDSPVTSDDTTTIADSFKLTIYNASLSTLATYYTDDDIDGTFAAPADGIYYVRVESGGNYTEEYGHSLQYNLTLTNSEDYAETEANDSTGTADDAVFGRYYVGQIGATADVDYFKYTVTNAGLISIDFDSPSESDSFSPGETFKVQVYNPSGSNITTFYTETDLSGFDFYADATGSYYIAVTRATFWVAEDYRIRATSSSETSGDDSDSTEFNGGAGKDNLTGTVGDDIIDGLAEADKMAGGSGDDSYTIDNKKDKIIELEDDGTDTVTSSIDLTLFGNVEKLILATDGTEALKGRGNTLDNSLVGNTLENSLWGLDGNDTLDGGAGNDKMYGGKGDDTYYIDSTDDRISEAGTSGGDDTVYASVDVLKWYSNVETVILTDTTVQAIGNNGSNLMYGNDGFNHLEGKGGDDEIFGEGGNDDVRGGSGSDDLTGGDGADTFVFDAALSADKNLDTINDFTSGTDKLWLSKSIFKKLAEGGVSADNYYEHAGDPSAQEEDDYLLYDSTSEMLYYDADGSGDGEAIEFVFLIGGGLSFTDILVV